MRWRIAHLLLLVVAAAIVLAVHRSLWGPTWLNARIVFGAYLACIVAASIAAFQSVPRWRRPWLGYAVFGWSWLVLVLRHYLGMVPDVFATNLITLSILGVALGVLCAVASHLLPGMRRAS